MGYSATKAAFDTLDKWTNACLKNSKSQNVWSLNGKTYFWENSRVEHDDGSIKGSIWKFVEDDKCKRCGTFRINGDGSIHHAPKFLKDA
jgi:hypothetical protein